MKGPRRKKPQTVFLVWCNEMIDLSVVYGVFTTREAAEECVRVSVLAEIQEIELDKVVRTV